MDFIIIRYDMNCFVDSIETFNTKKVITLFLLKCNTPLVIIPALIILRHWFAKRGLIHRNKKGFSDGYYSRNGKMDAGGI